MAKITFNELTDSKLESGIKLANDLYRAGTPAVSDAIYDAMVAELASRKPDHPFINSVEPEPEEVFGKAVELPERMLSTNKAYSHDEVKKWVVDVLEVGWALGIHQNDIFFKVTPKYDGFAAYDDGKTLYTRGNGRQGQDITRVLDRGVKVMGGVRGKKNGEIVVDRDWFEHELKGKYENSRNVIAAVIKEGELDDDIKFAIASEAIVFQPFSALSGWIRDSDAVMDDLESLWDWTIKHCEYDTDGLVIEATHEGIKREMGSTNHHHRWQIAFKKNTEFHNILVTGLEWQTAKTGRITPVVLLEPTRIGGVTVSKATGHHAGNVIVRGIRGGATVRVCRSGKVIPYIDDVVTGRMLDDYDVPSECPSCGAKTKMDGDNLFCTNEVDCPAQIERTIEYFFKTIGNCDGFGPSVIEKLCKSGISSVSEIYDMDAFEWAEIDGITTGIAANLIDSLENSQKIQIEDWRFLAAFSIPNVGKGGCERLLKHHRIEDVFNLTVDDIVQIDGFAEKTATSLVNSLTRVKSQVTALLPRFNLKRTTGAASVGISAISNKTVVFTGSMQEGKREDMEKKAKSLGAKVGSSVSSKTDYLVCGDNVGASKTDAAKKHGVKIITEREYLALIEAA